MSDPTASVTVGVDLGGTKVETALVDATGKIVESSRWQTNAARGAQGIVEDIAAGIRRYLGRASPHALGIGVAGQVEPGSGVVWNAPNLDWTDFPLRTRLAEAVGLPTFVLNDVQAATFGEWRHGAGQGVSDMVTIFVGTGVGGGVIADRRLIRGCDGSAGELGHLKVALDGRHCSCDRRGCLEAYAGGWAIARRAREAAEGQPREATRLVELAGGHRDTITAQVVADAFHQGDPLALALVKEVAQALGTGLASIANAFNPCLIILGGGVIDGLPELLDLARGEATSRAIEMALKSLRIERAGLGNHAGAVGAAAWARQEMRET